MWRCLSDRLYTGLEKKRVLTFHTEVPYFGESIKCVSKRLGRSSGSLSLLSKVNKSFLYNRSSGAVVPKSTKSEEKYN